MGSVSVAAESVLMENGDGDYAPLDVRSLVDSLRVRWSKLVWHREEMRRVVEMVSDDQRLSHCASSFVSDSQLWIADHLTVGIYAELAGKMPSAAQKIVDVALANYSSFLLRCNDAAHLGEREAFALKWDHVIEVSAPACAWVRHRLLFEDADPKMTFDKLDAGLDAMETFVLYLERGVTGLAPPALLCIEQYDWYDIFTLPWRSRDEAQMPDFDAMLPASTSKREVVIFPWLDVKKPIAALGMTIVPRAEAIKTVGSEDESALRERTNYFYDEFRKRLTPSVALHIDTDLDQSRALVARAVHALHFAGAVGNTPGGVMYTNSTMLEFFFQGLGGQPEFVARRTRRRYGGRLDGAATSFLRAQRPTWSGDRLQPNAEIIAALEKLADDPESEYIFEALRWYYIASTDADPIPPEIDRIHLRTAIEVLLREPSAGSGADLQGQLEKINRLTQRFVTWLAVSWKSKRRNFHQVATYVLAHARNQSVHGGKKKREVYAFEKREIPPDWIFDRLFVSLVVATLIAKAFSRTRQCGAGLSSRLSYGLRVLATNSTRSGRLARSR
jgi:hypothetical protein